MIALRVYATERQKVVAPIHEVVHKKLVSSGISDMERTTGALAHLSVGVVVVVFLLLLL